VRCSPKSCRFVRSTIAKNRRADLSAFGLSDLRPQPNGLRLVVDDLEEADRHPDGEDVAAGRDPVVERREELAATVRMVLAVGVEQTAVIAPRAGIPGPEDRVVDIDPASVRLRIRGRENADFRAEERAIRSGDGRLRAEQPRGAELEQSGPNLAHFVDVGLPAEERQKRLEVEDGVEVEFAGHVAAAAAPDTPIRRLRRARRGDTGDASVGG
jgi:hypothetical protein